MKQLQQRIIAEGWSEDSLELEKHLQSQLSERDEQEERLWKKKSRIRWLEEGERNKKFFHRTTIKRRMHNNITNIQNP